VAACALGQTPAFEVASIRSASWPSPEYFAGWAAGGGCGKPLVKPSGNRVTITRITLCGLIRVAYDMPEYAIVGMPTTLMKAEQSNYFDVRAEGEGSLTPDEARSRLQTLLADRFKLKFHRETKELPVYFLVVAKSGPKLSAESTCGRPAPPVPLTRGSRGLANCNPNETLPLLASDLTGEADRPVIDRTGLTGSYAFSLRWSPDAASQEPNAPPSLFTAVQEQLGLKLDPEKAPVEVLVIDRAEKPSEN
jgi:uncharacterized protein (TIGR03435 family)